VVPRDGTESHAALDLRIEDLQVVKAILQRYVPGIEVRVFGSRVGHTAKRYADLDLLLCGGEVLASRPLSLLVQAFADSDLSIKVDVVDGATLSPEWIERLLGSSVLLQAGVPRQSPDGGRGGGGQAAAAVRSR
jgi:predicted nucleotidyltransferase